MNELVNVEVVIDNFQDLENYNKEIVVERKGKKVKLFNKLLFKGDKYTVEKKRAEYLQSKGIVNIIDKKTSKSAENKEES